MAARVNVKFAILLAIGVFLVGGAGVVVAYFALNKTGETYIQRGDEALAAGDVELAAENYERAVGQDRTRVEWLEKWRSTLVQIAPDTQASYERSFERHYLGILEQLAVLEWDNPERQRELLEERRRQAMTLFPSAVNAWQSLQSMATQRIEQLDMSDPAARSLRRYRGLAILAQMAMTDVDQATRELALEDLRAAVEADPDDVESRRGIVLWHALRHRQAFLDRQTAETRRLRQALDSELAAMKDAFPGHPEALLTELEIEADLAMLTESQEIAKRAALRSMVGREAAVVEAFQNADAELLTAARLQRLRRMLSRLGASDQYEVMLELVDRALEVDPLNPMLVSMQADILGGLRRHDEAIANLESFLAEPIQPVSLDGMVQRYFQPQALQRLAEQALAKWETTSDPEEKEAALETARGALAQINDAALGGEGSVEALTVRGKLAQAENRNQEAMRIFTRLVEREGMTDSDTRWRLAQSLRDAGQLGASKSQLQLILDNEPTNLRALLSLADTHARLKEGEQALAVMATVRELYPDLEQLDRIDERLTQLLEVNPEAEATKSLISRARSLRADGTDDGARRAADLLRQAFEENPENVVVVVELVDAEAALGNVAEARRLVTRALTHRPDNRRLQALQNSLRFDDPFEAAIAMIDDSELGEKDKILRSYLLASRYGKTEQADAYAGRLRDEFPKEPAVIEVLFNRALAGDDLEAARRQVGLAAEVNADQANGLIFQGRLESAEGNAEAALRTYRQAAEILPYSSQLLLLLGQTELSLGLVEEGLRTLEKAYDARPDDPNVAMRYATVLQSLQRSEEALDVARSSIRINPLDLNLRNLWLSLEAAVGDEAVALEERRAMRESYPSDEQNSLALANLLIQTERWDEAATLIADLERDGQTMQTVLLRARLAAAEGDVERGQELISAYASSSEGEGSAADAMVALADFLLENGQPETAVEVLTDARDLQSPELLEVDRRLGDHFFNEGEFERALTYYENVLASNADDEDRVMLRTAEAYGKLGRDEDAEALLGRLANNGEDNLTAVLIRARLAAERGDDPAARRLYDRAVELKPDDPLPFLQRAQYNAQNPDQFNDALADVDQAIRLQPDLVMARRMKADMLAVRGRTSEAIAELRRAVDSDPANDDLRTALIQQFVRANDFPGAISFADRTVRDRPGEVKWLQAAGDLRARAAEIETDEVQRGEYWEGAASYYERIHEQEPSDATALRLANARLLQRDPDAQEALDLIEGMSEEARARGDIAILRARALHAVGREAEAEDAARTSLSRVTRDTQVRVWFDQLRQMYGGSVSDAARLAESLTPLDDVARTYELVLLTYLSGDPERQTEILSRLQAIEPDLEQPVDRVDVLRHIGRIQFQLGRHAASAETFAEAVEIAPRDLEFNNNLAYLRSEFLDDAQGAIEPAERAASIAPQNANVLDTLGWVYYRAEQYSQAQKALQSALQYATGPAEFIPVEIHLANVFLEKEDRPQAMRLFQSARERLADAPGYSSLYGEDLEALRTRLDQAE